MLYKYETHSHTCEASKCGVIDGASLAKFYKSQGYTGVFITDHFYKGNTAVPRELPWNEWVTGFIKGYQNAKAEGDKIGLDVFFAWEYSNGMGNDFLIYGLDEQWLYDHPEQIELKPCDYLKMVREEGAMIIHAHPFREGFFADRIKLLPTVVDGVEVINADMSPDVNRRADWYAREIGLRMTAGGDNHWGKRQHLAGVYLPERIERVSDYIRLVKEGSVELFADRYDEEGNRL